MLIILRVQRVKYTNKSDFIYILLCLPEVLDDRGMVVDEDGVPRGVEDVLRGND